MFSARTLAVLPLQDAFCVNVVPAILPQGHGNISEELLCVSFRTAIPLFEVVH